jgi:aspartyl-tRNA(Asn)/glutamyl-tRNA(Gln) amidotransferase subunit A
VSDAEVIALPAREIARRVREGELDARDVAAAFRRRINDLDGRLGSFLTLNEAEPARRPTGPLAGVPVAVKDNICTQGLPTTAASRILENYRPPYDATVVERLRAAGAYVIGKVNHDEFGMGSSTEYSAYQLSRNPYDLSRTPGGSSGGSAAAVAAGLAPLALGSDTGGSIRQPAAMCGVAGVKGTYGRVPRSGLISFAPSFDQIGPLARDVRDAALLFGVIAGHDAREATSGRRAVPDYETALDRNLGRLNLGLIKEFLGEGRAPDADAIRAVIRRDIGRDPADGAALATLREQFGLLFQEGAVEGGVRDKVTAAARATEAMGHTVDWAEIPSALWALPTYYVTVCGEAYSNLARYQGVLFGPRRGGAAPAAMTAATRGAGFGAEVRRRILAGAYVLSVGYRDRYAAKARAAREHMRAAFARAFERFDFLLSPVSPFTAFPLGTRNLDPQQMYAADIFTPVANLIDAPALSLPCGFDADGRPIGLHVIARPWDEERLFAFAYQLERTLGLPSGPHTPA